MPIMQRNRNLVRLAHQATGRICGQFWHDDDWSVKSICIGTSQSAETGGSVTP